MNNKTVLMLIGWGGLFLLNGFAWAEAPKVLTNSIGMNFVLIPAGSYMMGTDLNVKKGRKDEAPRHLVKIIKPFYLAQYEVTQQQWVMIMGENPSKFKGQTRPVDSVSWITAQQFIKKLNAKEGGTPYRLPTEVEWEYACRAGMDSTYSFGDDLVEVEVEDASKATWQPKDKLYLFKRVFDLERDNNWRYTQDGERVVIQKRFNKILSYNGAIDLVLDAGTNLEWMNLRLKTEDGDEIIVDWNSIPKQILKDDNDRLRVRILLSELQRLHKQLILEEMIIFLSGTVDEILKNRPLHSIHWMGIENESETKDNFSEDSQSDQDLKSEGNDKENLVSQLGKYSWYGFHLGNANKQTHAVGEKEPNSFGLHDMHGNVWELVNERTANTLSIAGDSSNSWFRGGSWFDGAGGVHCAVRNSSDPAAAFSYLGFRLLRIMEPLP